MQPADKLRREIAKSYDSNPMGWSVLVGRDSRNFNQILISHGSQAWMLKEELINPYRSVGFGVELAGGVEALRGTVPQQFGLRPLNKRQIGELADLMRMEESPRDFLLRVMRSKPVPTSEVRSPLVVQGPVVATSNPLGLLSDKHRELDLKLREELEKLLLRKYPQTVIPYL